jgi:hypothetical protein
MIHSILEEICATSFYLIAAGNAVFHILGPGDIEQTRIAEGAKPAPDDVLTYPADL